MNTKHLLQPSSKIEGRLIYIANEQSLDFNPKDQSLSSIHDEITLVIAQTLQILVALPRGKLMYVFGYMPLKGMRKTSLVLPTMREGQILFQDGDIESGISYDTSLQNSTTFIDDNSGWICIGDKTRMEATLIASSTAICIAEGELQAVWLHPEWA